MDGWITIGTELDTKKFDAQILQLERKANDLEKQLEDPKSLGFSDEDIQQIQVELEKTKNKLVSLRKEKQKLEETKGTQGITQGINNLGNSFQNAVSKAGRLALAIFGIRTAYNLLKSASSELATYDEQYATNLEYIRFVLTQAIAPVLRGIVQLAMQLLSYINAIVQAWFGINLFANGSAEQFKKMKAQAGGVSKAVKEIKKQLAGFDEVNILTDQSDSGTSAGAGGVGMPTMDLSAMQGKPPIWLQWIIDHKDAILSVLGGIAAGLVALKLGLGGIKALGIGIMVTGIIRTIQGLIGYLNDPSWENFGKVIQGIGLIIVGFGVLIGGIPAIVIGAVVLIVGTIMRYWEQIKGFLERGIGWLQGKSEWIGQQFGGWVQGLYDTFVKFLGLIVRYFDDTFKAIKRVFDGIIEFIRGVFSGNWEQAWNGIKNIFGGIIDWCKAKLRLFLDWFDQIILDPINSFINEIDYKIRKLLGQTQNINFSGGIEASLRVRGMKDGGIFNIPRQASGGIFNMPNRGTFTGSSIIGESGPEAAIPLSNEQSLTAIGEAIGKHVVINTSIINKMNTRTISRELVRAQNEQDFAYNG